MYEVVNHLLRYLISIDKYIDYIVLLQSTTPPRSKDEIEEMINYTIDNKIDSSFSVSPGWHHLSDCIFINDDKVKFILDPGETTRRQDSESILVLNKKLY